ncbi:hypothetical protein GCK72_007051 [Caenorhabditis remanei]|uniref:Uncharacterized protein n=1 Tax=Caenorhabditis remanei TaxID=31234 RepID=A0A6A5HL34_CAERE|nr:hypothetical protein GCK72_007051 [Caenorhabditis remanei]KAF1767093.1 hypothetical protein GCK72_007051 [Caenorhabditis remanei]
MSTLQKEAATQTSGKGMEEIIKRMKSMAPYKCLEKAVPGRSKQPKMPPKPLPKQPSNAASVTKILGNRDKKMKTLKRKKVTFQEDKGKIVNE